jgi:hypothetical protein
MAKGNIAKQVVEDKIKEVFGSDYIGVFDKKLYVWADDGGERVQVALAMTCPKIFVGDDIPVETPDVFKPVDISDDEQQNIKELIERLGL